MQNNHSDKFEASQNNPFETNSTKDSFFLKEDFFQTEPIRLYSSEAPKRLNDYDSILLEEDAYKNVNDELFQLEYKISKFEKDLKNIETEIFTAQSLDDEKLLKSLYLKKEILLDEYNLLIKKYDAQGLPARISGNVSRVWTNKFLNNNKNKTKSIFNKILKFIESNLPKNVAALIELKKSLSVLENINKNVDDLVSMNSPYGERDDKYEKLSKYILKANSIQNSITKEINRK